MESVSSRLRRLLDETTKSGTDLMSTQDNSKQDKWLQEIRDSQGDYEQEVMSGHEADLYKCFNSCTKNPGHVQFIHVNTFRSEHLPERYRSDQKLTDIVRAQADLTCLIKVSYISPDRPHTSLFYNYRDRSDFSRSATGWVRQVIVYTEEDKGENCYRSCQCQTCQRSGEPRSEWAEVWIFTARHVVFDKSEAEDCKCYFSYDNPQQQPVDCPVLTGHQVDWVRSHSNGDVTKIYYRTHDLVWARKLKDMRHRYDSLRDDLEKKYVPIRHAAIGTFTKKNVDENFVQLSSDKSKDNNPGVQDHLNHYDNDDDDRSYKPEHDLVIITSHPHGCSKMVTLGHLTDRRINPYNSYEYNTATCPGSSGALVFILSNRYWLYYTYAHSRSVRGQGPDQINRCDAVLFEL